MLCAERLAALQLAAVSNGDKKGVQLKLEWIRTDETENTSRFGDVWIAG
jgi:hypothetical protein